MKRDLAQIGSKTAIDGFKNEKDVANKFNNWKSDADAQAWLEAMNYKISEIDKVEAETIKGNYKSDIQVRVKVYLKTLIGVENISLKLVSGKAGFNQVDKRWVDKYVEMWNIPNSIAKSLKLFTGETAHNKAGTRDKRRMYFNEMPVEIQNEITNFFNKNKILILADILKGNDEFAAAWLMVVWRSVNETTKWIIRDINYVLNFFGSGEVIITKKGNLKIARVTMQRKGGDAGRSTANMLQFKINPLQLFQID